MIESIIQKDKNKNKIKKKIESNKIYWLSWYKNPKATTKMERREYQFRISSALSTRGFMI